MSLPPAVSSSNASLQPLPIAPSLARLNAEFDALDACHQKVLDTLAELGMVLERLQDEGVSAAVRAGAQRVVTFFDTTAHDHHAEEDRLVFPPLLEGTDAGLAEKVRRLQQDHVWLEQDWQELKLQLEAIAKGYSWYDPDQLRAAVGVFVALYLDHIDLEESIVYPSAHRRLSERAHAGAARVAAEQQRLRAA
ncbi:MAG: hypothetical protein RIQ60_1369 [Pseudomonadota bacterium]|jgi:hemerythrin-like domain-containing protein